MMSLERRIEMIERHAHLARTLAQSLAFSRSVDRAMAEIKRVSSAAKRYELFNAVVRATTVQVEMWRARASLMEN